MRKLKKKKKTHQHQKSSREEIWVPFCCREASCCPPSASRTGSVPWSPAVVTWFPSRQHRSTAPSAQTVNPRDTSDKSELHPAERSVHDGHESVRTGRRRILRAWCPPRVSVWSEHCDRKSASNESDDVKRTVTIRAASGQTFQNKSSSWENRILVCHFFFWYVAEWEFNITWHNLAVLTQTAGEFQIIFTSLDSFSTPGNFLYDALRLMSAIFAT